MAIENNIEGHDQLESIRRCIDSNINSLNDILNRYQNESDTLVMSRDKYEKESKQKDVVLERLLTLIASIYSKFESDSTIVRLIDDTREELEQDGIHLKYYKRGDSDVDVVENPNYIKETNEPSMDGKVESMFSFGLSFENLAPKNNIEPIAYHYMYIQPCDSEQTLGNSSQNYISNSDTKMNKGSEKTEAYKYRYSFGEFDEKKSDYIVVPWGSCIKYVKIIGYDKLDNVCVAKENKNPVRLPDIVGEILGSICTKYKPSDLNTIKEKSNKCIEADKFRSTFDVSNNEFSQYNIFYDGQRVTRIIKVDGYKPDGNISVANESESTLKTCLDNILKSMLKQIEIIPGSNIDEKWLKNNIKDILKRDPVFGYDGTQKGQQKQEGQCKKKSKCKNTSNGQSEDAVGWVKDVWRLKDAH